MKNATAGGAIFPWLFFSFKIIIQQILAPDLFKCFEAVFPGGSYFFFRKAVFYVGSQCGGAAEFCKEGIEKFVFRRV